MTMHHIVIVGGGAGGILLATRLGKKLGKRKKAKITLVDESPTHLWKPLLHEVAAGTLDAHQDEIDYLVHASTHHYYFQLGCMVGLNRTEREISIAPVLNGDQQEIIPSRKIQYDTLVMAVGGITNDLNVPGVNENCVFLDNLHEAKRFQQLFLKSILRLQSQIQIAPDNKLNIVIVGGGATGVELAAELHYTVRQAVAYGLDRIVPERDVKITLIEAAEKLLPHLPERISKATELELDHRGITVFTNERVAKVTDTNVVTVSGKEISSTITVWAAGIKAPPFLKTLDGLETNHLNQLLVEQTLQTRFDEHIFAIGDCASCPQPNTDKPVPPRAQAAYQESELLTKSFTRYLKQKPLLPFVYHDYGSLISLSRYETLGSLMGKLTGSILIEGKLARLVYLSLYKKHQMVIQGKWRVILLTIANLLTRRLRPRLKLH